jgi:hypothetical protein
MNLSLPFFFQEKPPIIIFGTTPSVFYPFTCKLTMELWRAVHFHPHLTSRCLQHSFLLLKVSTVLHEMAKRYFHLKITKYILYLSLLTLKFPPNFVVAFIFSWNRLHVSTWYSTMLTPVSASNYRYPVFYGILLSLSDTSASSLVICIQQYIWASLMR